MRSTTAAVVGPGAIGLTVAAALAAADVAELSVYGRRPFDVLTPRGLDDQARVLEVPCTRGPRPGAPPVDWVFLCVKAHQVPSAASLLASLVGVDTRVAILQNGVEHVELVRPYVGSAELIPTIVWCSAQRTGTGAVEVHSRPIFVVPSPSPHEALARLLGADADVVPTDDFVSESWRKLSRNAVGSLMALTGQPSRVYRDPAVADLARRLALECIAVACAAGAQLDDGYADEIVESLAQGPPDRGNSMLDDRRAGRPLEWDARNGVICRRARDAGVPTPVSDVLVPLLAAINR